MLRLVIVFVGLVGCSAGESSKPARPVIDAARCDVQTGHVDCSDHTPIGGLSAPEAFAVRCAEEVVAFNGYTDAGGPVVVTTLDILELLDCASFSERFGTLERHASLVCERRGVTEVMFLVVQWQGRGALSFAVTDAGVHVRHGGTSVEGVAPGCRLVPEH